MSVLAVGVNHRSAPLALLEQLAVPSQDLPKALRSLTELEHVLEAVVLSTCNRVEVYVHVTRFHAGMQEVAGWMAARGDVHPQDLDEILYAYYDDRAAAHLFSVAGGLDSMIIGEQQIAMQVRDAMELAREQGTARRMLQRLFRQAVRTGRRIRRETEISSGASSMVDVGLRAALSSLGAPDLAGRHVLLIGAGKVGGLTAARLVDEGVAGVEVWNRSRDKAHRLAAKVDGQIVEDAGLAAAIGRSDLVVCTTGAPEPLLDAALVARATTDRDMAARPLVLLDLAMPRNVDPACDQLAAVAVVDIADVRTAADRTVTGDVVASATEIVEAEAKRFLAWLNAIEVEPTIRSLRTRAEHVRRAEIERLSAKLSGLDARQREAVEALSRGIINTLLHEPTIRLKELADAGGAEHYANALRELFELDE